MKKSLERKKCECVLSVKERERGNVCGNVCVRAYVCLCERECVSVCVCVPVRLCVCVHGRDRQCVCLYTDIRE